MRWQKLLAIAAVCPLAVVASACQRIDQPIGQYSAASTRAARTSADGTSEPNMQPSASPSNDAEPATPSDAGEMPWPPNTPGERPVMSGSDPMQPTAAPFMPPATATIPTETPGPDGMKKCQATAYAIAERMRLDMYIVMDANITLPVTGLWEFVTSGLRGFVSDRRSKGIGVGLRFFGATCDPDEYNFKPQVEVGVLPDNLTELLAALAVRSTYTASPMAPALQGGIAHQLRRAKANPGTKQIVVLLTDGFTQDLTCRYTRQDVENEAAKGFTSDPQIETYVIGFGLPDTMNAIADDVLARFAALDPIAEQGGTRKAYNVKFSEDPVVLEDALSSIRRTAQPCVFDVPEDVDPATLNAMFLSNAPLKRMDDKAKCGPMGGFFYNNDASGKPVTFELCATSCNALQSTDALLVLYTGCPTNR